jgi:hypothetical protein
MQAQNSLNSSEKKPIKLNPTAVWKGGYTFALILLFVLGMCLIVVGTIAVPNGSMWNVILVNTGVAMAPAAFVAQLFRVFLFEEIKFELTQPVLDEVRDRLGPEIKTQIDTMVSTNRKETEAMLQKYQDEITTIQALKESGVIRPYRNREIALKEFASAIDAETREIMVIGSSLKGLLIKEKYREIADKLRFKLENKVTVKFLLTHPIVADLRAGQEGRRSSEIGAEIIESLEELRRWKVPAENVRLYRGTPTCFAIKTEKQMLLNPYPYGEVAYDSPCLIVDTSNRNPSYIYHEFDQSHFGAWDTKVAVKISDDYNETISQLQRDLEKYAENISDMFKG